MKIVFALILLLCTAFASVNCSKKSSVVGTQPVDTVSNGTPVPKTYQLVWADEFNTDGAPDSTKWGYDLGGNGWGNNELEYYTKSPDNVRVSGGNLIIEAKMEKKEGRNYTSARLLTKNKAQWTYGKFDIKAKIPKGKGTWPAIWMLSANDPLHWPDDGELDIMEEVGFNPNVIYGTAHNKAYNGANGLQKGGNKLIADAQDSFHVYSLEWTPTAVTWSIDSTAFFKYTKQGGNDVWPYDKDFFMILNLAIGGNWGGQQGVDNSVFPQQMLVDYVRVYQLK